MKFYSLDPIDVLGNPHSTYDCVSSLIVRANDEKEARQLASEVAQDETAECWLNPEYSTCVEYKFPTKRGKAEVVFLWDHPG